jgi:hypothetical protein
MGTTEKAGVFFDLLKDDSSIFTSRFNSVCFLGVDRFGTNVTILYRGEEVTSEKEVASWLVFIDQKVDVQREVNNEK